MFYKVCVDYQPSSACTYDNTAIDVILLFFVSNYYWLIGIIDINDINNRGFLKKSNHFIE